MEQWNIWLERDLWLNVAIVVVATALIYSVLRTLVNTLHKRLKAWSKDQDGKKGTDLFLDQWRCTINKSVPFSCK